MFISNPTMKSTMVSELVLLFHAVRPVRQSVFANVPGLVYNPVLFG